MLQVSMAFSLSMNEFGVTLHVTVKVAKIFNSFFFFGLDAKIQYKFVFVLLERCSSIIESISKLNGCQERQKKTKCKWMIDIEMLNIIVCYFIHTNVRAWHVLQATLRVCQIATLQVAFSMTEPSKFIAMESIHRWFLLPIQYDVAHIKHSPNGL